MIEVLRAVDRVSIPWKNGLGRTSVVAVAETPDGFLWRVSIADEVADTPFSSFPGVDRHLTPLPGSTDPTTAGGFGVTRNGKAVHVAERDVVSFSGEEPIASGSDADGHTALNLMVSRESHVASLDWRELSGEPVDIAASADSIVLVVSGTVRLSSVATPAIQVQLGPLDAVRISVDSATIVGPAVVIVCTITPIETV